MNNLALGQYVNKDSIIHKLDPRTKICSLIVLMIGVFLIPNPTKCSNPMYSFIALGAFGIFVLAVILMSKISLIKYLKSLKQSLFLMLFTFVIQLFTKRGDGDLIVNSEMYYSICSILIVVTIFVIFFIVRKYLPWKMFIFLCLIALSVWIFTIDFSKLFAGGGFNHNFGQNALKMYKAGLYTGIFFTGRVMLIILLSTTLTLTTKPTDLTSGLEWLLHPLTYLKINVSIFAMMISLALRFIPTLFNETQKILKAQASRGVDLKEGNLKSQISQIISLLVPMFVISYKRAEDLADAMEARAYIPGEKRTRILKMKFRASDWISMVLVHLIFAGLITWSILV